MVRGRGETGRYTLAQRQKKEKQQTGVISQSALDGRACTACKTSNMRAHITHTHTHTHIRRREKEKKKTQSTRELAGSFRNFFLPLLTMQHMASVLCCIGIQAGTTLSVPSLLKENNMQHRKGKEIRSQEKEAYKKKLLNK